uniref:MARVEL domain-containing protein n=1 Tax=Panagrellus redivivus TaxID=6233 RepID=A0A7E4VFW0_PANRE
MTSSSEDFTSSTESGPSTITTTPSTFGGRYLAGADSDGGSRRHRSRSKSKSRRSTSTRKAHSRSSKKPSSSKSRRSGHSSKSRRSGHSSKSRRSGHSSKSRSRKASSGSRSHKSRRHSSKSGSHKSRHGSRSSKRSRSQSKSRSARRNQSEWHKATPQQKSLSCCSSFGIVVQAAVLLLAFFYTIFSYYNAHSTILYVLTVYTIVQGAVWIVFMLSNCVAALHGACIQFMVVTFVGLVELALFMYFMITDSRPSCDRFGCTFMHGAFEHRFGAVALFVIGFIVHGVYAVIFICEAVSQWKQWEEYDAEQKAAKERIVIARVSRRSRKSRRSSSQTETKSDKPKKSRSSTKSKSASKKPSKSKSKSRRSKRSTRSQTTVATVSSVPSTTSMVSYVPQQKPVSTQPLQQLPSHSSVQSGYGHHCPVDALQCNVPNCPYYRQNQELVRQLSSCHQNLSNSASFRQPPQQQGLQPTVRQEIGPDQSRSIVIDLPQTQSQTVANYNNGNLGGGYGDNTVDIQRVVVKIPPPGHQQLQPQQSAIRDAEGNAYLTTITPVQKALR